MKTAIVNGRIITGDGKTELENSSLVIEENFIAKIHNTRYIPYDDSNRIIDAEGGFVIPGIINNHTHEAAFGPVYHGQSETGPTFFGRKRQPIDRIMGYLNKHLLEGETTLLSLDGFTSVWDVEAMNKIHPMNIRAATLHTQKNLESILLQGGFIDEFHRGLTAEEMVSLGAVAIGETGVPGSPYGLFEFWREIARPIAYAGAMRLSEALFVNPGSASLLPYDEDAVSLALKEAGLEGLLAPRKAREVAERMARQHQAAEEALKESTLYAKRLRVPVITHHSPENADAVAEVARELGPMLVAGHSNHMFAPEEAVKRARELKKNGAFVDIYSGDYFGARQLVPSPETTFALMEEGLVDTISTDFLGGFWDPILLLIEKAAERGVVSLPQGMAMATGNVVRAVPKLAPNRGIIAPGKIADLVITDSSHPSRVKTVIISGRVVVDYGRLT